MPLSIKKIALILGVLLFLYTVYLWYGYTEDQDYKSALATCRNIAGSIEERKDCSKFPEKKHEAKFANALLWTIITFSIPSFLLGSQWLYFYFFVKKKQNIDRD